MTSLNDICYEQIKDSFYYGLFGDFKLIIDKETGFFNATKLCKAGGKDYSNWRKNKQTEELILFYEKMDKRSPPSNPKGVIHVYEVCETNDGVYNKLINGTYVREELILSIAVWISNDFYDKVFKIIMNYFIQEFKNKYEDNETKLKNKLSSVENKMNKLRNVNKEYKDDITPKTINKKKSNMFLILKKNKEGSFYPYYVIRCQREIHKRQINKMKEKYPDLEIVYKLEYNPNGINLFNRVKENVNKIQVKFNHLRIDSSFDEFIENLEKLIPKLE